MGGGTHDVCDVCFGGFVYGVPLVRGISTFVAEEFVQGDRCERQALSLRSEQAIRWLKCSCILSPLLMFYNIYYPVVEARGDNLRRSASRCVHIPAQVGAFVNLSRCVVCFRSALLCYEEASSDVACNRR